MFALGPMTKQFFPFDTGEFLSIESEENLPFHLCLCNIRIFIKDSTAYYLLRRVEHGTTHAQALLAGSLHYHISVQNSNIRVCVEHFSPSL